MSKSLEEDLKDFQYENYAAKLRAEVAGNTGIREALLMKRQPPEAEPDAKLILEDGTRTLCVGGERIKLCRDCLKRYLGLD